MDWERDLRPGPVSAFGKPDHLIPDIGHVDESGVARVKLGHERVHTLGPGIRLLGAWMGVRGRLAAAAPRAWLAISFLGEVDVR